MQTEIEIKVSEEEIDDLGHVNNSIYVSYLEKGRADWYRQAGIPVDQMRKRKLGTVILRLDILYKKEVRLGDELHIITRPVRLGNKSFVFEHVIKNQAGETASEATVTNVMFDLSLRKSIPVVEKIARHFRQNNRG